MTVKIDIESIALKSSFLMHTYAITEARINFVKIKNLNFDTIVSGALSVGCFSIFTAWQSLSK